MKLLIITQKADRTDPVLGFFCRWVEEFALRAESVTVIAQQAGEYRFPLNVHIHSLGKETGRSRAMQIVRFWMLIGKHRHSYDGVLVHMTPVWVLLGWPMWFLLRKRLYLWYEIRRGSWRLSLALLLVRKVFCATVQGLPSPHRKQVVTGHGVDTCTFCLPLTRPSHSLEAPSPILPTPPGRGGSEVRLIISVGRITRSKRYDVILRAFAALPRTCELFIAGGMITRDDEAEWERLQSLIRELGIAGRVSIAWVPPAQMPELLQRASLMLHACVGGLDKAVLEAMACGCPVVSSSGAAQEILPEICRATDASMGAAAQRMNALVPSDRSALAQELRRRIVAEHSLPALVERLVREMH